MQPGKHFIRVLRRNKEVEDSPYLFTAKGDSTDYHMPGTPCQVNLHQSYYIAQDEINQMTAVLRLPNNRSEPIPHLREGRELFLCNSNLYRAGSILLSSRKEINTYRAL